MNFLKIAEGIVVQPLLLDLVRQPDLWDVYDFRSSTPGSPHTAAETILLRCQPMDRTLADPHESVDFDALKALPEARRLMLAIAAQVGSYRVGRAMITRLYYPDEILPHSDVGDHQLQYCRFRYWGRYHLVLQSHPAALFRCGEEVVHMAPGELWYFRNDLEHAVYWDLAHYTIREGLPPRIHLIVDCHTANELEQEA